MPRFRDLESYRRAQKKRAAAIRQANIKTSEQAASFFATQARQLAPKNSWSLIRSIRRKKNIVEVGRGLRYPYHHWINQTPGKGMRTLKVSRKFINGRWGYWIKINNDWVDAKTANLVYKKSPAHWTWTGQARFWQLATLRTRPYFNNLLVEEVRGIFRTVAG